MTWAVRIAVLAALIAYPLAVPTFWTLQIGAQSLVLGTIALSLTLLAGYGGMLSLAQMTVAGLAGYGVALFGPASPALGVVLPWPLTVLVALALGTLSGIVIGALSVRTVGIYTVMITLAIGMGVFYFTQQNYSVFNGFTGFSQVQAPAAGAVSLRDPVPFYYLCLTVAALALVGIELLGHTTFGLALKGIRDNPRRMRALGYEVYLHRTLAFGLAGFVAALGGVLAVWYNGRISPGTIGLTPIINVLVIGVIGGLASPVGAFVGAVVFTLLDNFAIDLMTPERFNTVIGVAFVLIVLSSPDGLTGLVRRISTQLSKKPPIEGGLRQGG